MRGPGDQDSSVPSTPTARRVAQTDRAGWDPLWEGYNRFCGRQLPAEITDTTWSRFFDPDEPVHALVAERGGEPFGLTPCLFHRSTIMIGPTCYLQDLFTAEKARGRGIGPYADRGGIRAGAGRRCVADLLADARDQPQELG
jgi:GNAT superfamily N-acetyltransferase